MHALIIERIDVIQYVNSPLDGLLKGIRCVADDHGKPVGYSAAAYRFAMAPHCEINPNLRKYEKKLIIFQFTACR